jgi:defect-in-organelle-trafficking protein DotC
MREAAAAYGARAGLAYATREINRRLDARASELSTSYNFQSLMISGPNGVMVNPPIIVEAQESWESSDAGKTLRVADTVYEIVEQSRFTSVAPMWQTYLVSNFDEAETPPDALLPRTPSEKESWKRWVSEGWRQGEEQANEIFQTNLDRLNRDYTGMVRYKSLLEEGKVSPARLAEAELGNTGTGQDMRVNDRAIRITEDPSLQINPRGWSASATTKTKEGDDKGAAVQSEDMPVAKPQKKTSNVKKPAPKPAKTSSAKSIDKPKIEKGGRF